MTSDIAKSFTGIEHIVRAYAITSELAKGSACTVVIASPCIQMSGHCLVLPGEDVQITTLAGVCSALTDLSKVACPGDTISIKTVWGGDLPTHTGAVDLTDAFDAQVQAFLKLTTALRDDGVEVVLHEDQVDQDTSLVRHASMALMQAQMRPARNT